MPIDASIYQNIKPIETPSPLDQYAKVSQLKALMGQNNLQALQTEKLTNDLGEEKAVKDVFARGGSLDDLLPDVMKVSPTRGIALQKSAIEQKAAQTNQQKAELEKHAAQVKQYKDLVASTDPTNYDPQALRSQAIRIFGDEAKQFPIPDTFDPNWQRTQVMTGDKFLELAAPKIQAINLGGKTQLVDTNPNSPGYKPNVDLTHTPTIGETESGRHNHVAEGQAAATLGETKRFHQAQEGTPNEIEQTAQAIAKGQLAPLSGYALARPAAQKVMARVVEINPQFDPTNFHTRQKVETDFASGKQGNSVRSFNTAIAHLDTLDQLSDALQNGNTPLFNKLGNTIATQTGGAAPTNFEGAKKIVADEVVKAIVGSGGGVADREEAAATIKAASSPAQLKGIIKTYKELMKGQLHGLRQQYEQNGGKNFDRMLSPEAKNAEGGTSAIRSQADAIIGR